MFFCFFSSNEMNLSKMNMRQSIKKKKLFCDYKVYKALLIYSATEHLMAS